MPDFPEGYASRRRRSSWSFPGAHSSAEEPFDIVTKTMSLRNPECAAAEAVRRFRRMQSWEKAKQALREEEAKKLDTADLAFLQKVRAEAVELEGIQELELRAAVSKETLWDLIEPLCRVCWREAAEMGQAGFGVQDLENAKKEIKSLKGQLRECNASAMREISNLKAQRDRAGSAKMDFNTDHVHVSFHEPINFLEESVKQLVLDIVEVKEMEMRGKIVTDEDIAKMRPDESSSSSSGSESKDDDDDDDDDDFFPNCSRSASKVDVSDMMGFRRLGSSTKLTLVQEANQATEEDEGDGASPSAGSARRVANGDAGAGEARAVVMTPPSRASPRGDDPEVKDNDETRSEASQPFVPSQEGGREDADEGEDEVPRPSLGAPVVGIPPAAPSVTTSAESGGSSPSSPARKKPAQERKSVARGSKLLRQRSSIELTRGAAAVTTAGTQTKEGYVALAALEAENRKLRLALEELRMKFAQFMEKGDAEGLGESFAKLADEVGMTPLLKIDSVYERLYQDALKRPERLEEFIQNYIQKYPPKREAGGASVSPVAVVEGYLAEYPLRLLPKTAKEEDVALTGDAKANVGRRAIRTETGPSTLYRLTATPSRPDSALLRATARADSELLRVGTFSASNSKQRPDSAARRPDSALKRPDSALRRPESAAKRPDSAAFKRPESAATTAATATPGSDKQEMLSPEEAQRVASFLQQRRRMQTCEPEAREACRQDCRQTCNHCKSTEALASSAPVVAPNPKGTLVATAGQRTLVPFSTAASSQPANLGSANLGSASLGPANLVQDGVVFKRRPRPQISLPSLCRA